MTAILFSILLALVAGTCLPTQAGINARLNLWARSPILSAAISFGVGTLALVCYALILKIPFPEASPFTRHPWWIWTGGFLGAFFVASTIVLAPRLGAAAMLSFIISGQLIASVVLDHFGLLGYPEHPVSLLRLTGIVLVVAGAVLVRLF